MMRALGTDLVNNSQARETDKLRAVDLLNQMEGVYITKIESKQAAIVELVIVTEDKVVEGEVVPEPKAPIVPVGSRINLMRTTSRHRNLSTCLN